MIYPYNVHMHTTFCDGKNTPEEMVLAAIKKGFKCIGFSGHSPMPVMADWCMSRGGEVEYRSEILRLREKYQGKIDILLGFEFDICSKTPDYKYDYIIGSVHHLPKDGEYFIVDHTYEYTVDGIERLYNGDIREYVREYYYAESMVPEITNADIIGHFDIVNKFNEGGRMFDEQSGWYRELALDSLKKLISYGKPFEINTGGIYRKCRTVPYPAEFILKAIKEWGGEIMINGDSHDCPSLDFFYDDAVELAKSCGFKYAKAITPRGFITVPL